MEGLWENIGNGLECLQFSYDMDPGDLELKTSETTAQISVVLASMKWAACMKKYQIFLLHTASDWNTAMWKA